MEHESNVTNEAISNRNEQMDLGVHKVVVEMNSRYESIFEELRTRVRNAQ